MKIATEKELWTKVLRPALHAPAEGRIAYKVQDAFVKGLPDVIVNVAGDVWWLELKVVSRPVRASTPWRVRLTPEQRRFLNEWSRTAGNAAVVVYDSYDEVLHVLRPDVPEEVANDERFGLGHPWTPWTIKSLPLKQAREPGRLERTLLAADRPNPA